MPRHIRSLAPLLPALLLAGGVGGCSHTELATAPPAGRDTPLTPGEPLRLTYNAGYDGTASWSPDAARIVYAFDRDRTRWNLPKGCVGDLPASGGSRGWELCDTEPMRRDTSTVARWPALRGDGAVALVRQRYPIYGPNPYYSDLALRPAGQGEVPGTILPVPYFFPPSGRSHQGIAFLQWLDHDRLLWLGEGVIRSTNDNVETGFEIVILAPAEGPAGLTMVPGTTWASSVTRGATADTIYYTLGGDSRVYRRTLSTGVVDTVADFGGLGIARDVQVRNGRLVAVVGGSVTWGTHPSLGMAQYDGGGPIYAIDLPDGAPVLVGQDFDRYRYLALAPDGAHVVAQQFGDLWRLTLP